MMKQKADNDPISALADLSGSTGQQSFVCWKNGTGRMKNIPISLVVGANGTAPIAVLLESVFQDIQSGRYEDQIEQVRAAYREGGKKAVTSLKKKLPAVLFSGRFLERTDTGIQEHSGILVADLDELSAERISELRGSLEKDPYVMFVFLSPTGSGLKVGFKVPANADRHAASFAAVDAHVKREYGENIDPACKNLSRLCFVSHDPNLYVNWEADELEVPDITCSGQQMEGSSQSVFNETIEKFGNPFYRNRLGGISRINERFWAGLYLIENHLLYEPDEGRFYEYVEERGLWLGISEELLREHVAARLLVFSREPDGEGGEGFERKITRASEDTIIAHLKGQSEKKGIFDEKKRIIHCANGVLRLQPKGAANFTDFSVDDYSRNQSPIAYDPEGECPRFLNELIHGGVGKEDALLIQKWMGLAVLGDNVPQKFMILDGQPGGGKSTLIRVIREVVGAQNVSQLRTQHLDDRFEIFRYRGKTLLIGSDVSGKFLMHKYANVIKSLVGGDPLSGEGKNSNGSFDIK
ncbi:MAG: BT4734/BF3469 family protein, partial [Opitutales bacterium]